MKEYYCRQNLQGEQTLLDIKRDLANGEIVRLNNQHETFYGCGFDQWVEDALKDTPHVTKVVLRNCEYGYGEEFIIKPKEEELTANDEELIEMAYSTTYPSSIRQYIEQADTKKCREILRGILENADNKWED